MNEEETARFLGWFSIGLGIAEMAAPEKIADYLGIVERTPIVRAFGLREFVSGIGILASPKPSSGWLWARVAGDALDTAVLGSALTGDNPRKAQVIGTILAVSPIIALDIWCAGALSRKENNS